MDYRRTIEFLLSLQKFGIKFGLSSTENLLARLGNPHRELTSVHIAGTNGKGSVGATVTSILVQAGHRVGFFTSPHLVSFRERFVVGGEMISREGVVRLAGRVREVMDETEPPTFFEFVTAMAFLYFAEEKVDLAVMETGMGGRLDATNVVQPLVGVITNISLEHQDYLGRTLAAIAGEKAGIIKPGLDVVTGEKRPAIRDLFERVARAQGGRLYRLGRDFRVRRRNGVGFDYRGLDLNLAGLSTGLIGPHQVGNAGLALAVMELLGRKGIRFTEADIRAGLRAVTWPGRGEILPGSPSVMLDGAHNPAAAGILAEMLAGLEYRRLHLVLGIMADKNIPGVMNPLLPLAHSVYLTRPRYSRAAEPEALARWVGAMADSARRFADLRAAIDAARSEAGPDDLIVVTGSLFTVGEARAYLTGMEEDPIH